MLIHRIVLAFVCAVLLAGCYDARSTHPVGTTVSLAPDKALNGIWRDDYWRQDLGTRLHIFQSNTDELTALWIDIPMGDRELGQFHEYRFSTARLGSNRFISVAGKHEVDKPPAEYQLLFYTLRNGGRTFTLYTIEDNKVVKAIETGAIKGTVKKHEEKDSSGTVTVKYDEILITAEPAELDAFMAKPEAADLFNVYMVFKKVE